MYFFTSMYEIFKRDIQNALKIRKQSIISAIIGPIEKYFRQNLYCLKRVV